MKRENGFTLIELVICIIILATLPAVASVKYINIKTEGRNNTLAGIRGQIESQIPIIYSKLAISGLEKENASSTQPVTGGGYYGDEPDYNPFKSICGHDCYFIYGTPSASANTVASLIDGIGQSDDIVFSGYHANDWRTQGVTGTNLVGTFSFRDNVNVAANPERNSLKKERCFIWYSGARADRSYKIGTVSCD